MLLLILLHWLCYYCALYSFIYFFVVIVLYRFHYIMDAVNRATQNDEMCNLYVMYYAEPPHSHTSKDHPSQLTCSGVDQPDLLSSMPANSDVELPSRPDLEEDRNQFAHTHHQLSGWEVWVVKQYRPRRKHYTLQESRAVAGKPHDVVTKFDSVEIYSGIARFFLR